MTPKEILEKVRRIELRTRTVVSSYLSGEYHSAFKGRGIEFAEVREYQPGDDIRTIDWNVTARMGRPFVKVYEEERELAVMLMVDASSSGEFGSVEQTKNEIAVEVCALLAFSAIKNNDRVGLIIFTNRVERYVPPKKGRKHVLRVVRELLTQFEGPTGDGGPTDGDAGFHERAGSISGVEADPEPETPDPHDGAARPRPIVGASVSILTLALAALGIARMEPVHSWLGWAARGALAIGALLVVGLIARTSFRPPKPDKGRGTDIANALDFLNRTTKERGIAFLVSDFQATGFEKALRMARQRHDVVAITVTDPREVRLARVGLLSLEDTETGEQVVVDASDPGFRDYFEGRASERESERIRLFRSSGIDYIDVWTDRSYVDPIIRFFALRAKQL